MLINKYRSIICLRPKDESTDFLNPIGELFGDNYKIVDDTESSHSEYLETLENLGTTSLIVFLGHGMSGGLHSANTNSFKQRLYITIDHSYIFNNKSTFLLACRSGQFVQRLSGHVGAIGFGNIISSREEVLQEIELTNEELDLDIEDVEKLKKLYVTAFVNAFNIFLNNKITFKKLHQYVSFFLNKEINHILKSTHPKKLEISKQLFLLRNEMIFKKKQSF